MGILGNRRETTPVIPDELRDAKRTRIGEIAAEWTAGLRTSWRSFQRTFWPTQPSYAGSMISYNKARALYRNDDRKSNLGAGFSRRIINSNADFIGLPFSSTGDEVYDEFLNNCIWTYWPAELQQMVRDATRDSKTIVRIRRDDPESKLVSAEEWEACYLEIVPPEKCAIYYLPNGGRKEIEVAYIRHEVEMIKEERIVSGRSFREPQTRTHTIIEEIRPDRFSYWNETEGRWLEDWAAPNDWGFVPLVEVFNEYDAVLEGGQSDLEAPLAFILAFHDVMGQTLQAHKAHSIPKAHFKVNDVMQFIANNWPESFESDAAGNVIPGTFNGQISWKGTEILFTGAEEDAGYLQAESVLGDSTDLLEWLLDCISMASEVPKSILMKGQESNPEEMTAFAHKINRKRLNFMEAIQSVCKMVLAINLMEPTKVPLAWEEITPELALKKAETLQQVVMGTEVLATRKVISDRTVRQHIRPYIPSMKSNDQESNDAQDNEEIPVTSPNSVSGTDSGANE